MVSGSIFIPFKKFRFFFFLFFLCLLISVCPAVAQEVPSSKIILEYPAEIPNVDFKTKNLLDRLPSDSAIAVWVFFTDKGITTDGEYRKAVEECRYQLSERSVKRRMLRGKKPIFDFTDIPVKNQYLDELTSLGVKIRVVSKWLNSASVMANKNRIKEIEKLPFVRAIQKVVTFYRKEPSFSQENLQKFYEAPKDQILGYGESYAQLAQVHVPELHNLGYSGKGVLITMLDTGYLIDHPAFDSILNSGRLVATHDFINGDDNVQDGPDQQRDHGTYTFSAVGGFVEDTLIGPAYGAQFALAKTEVVASETQTEEDHWVAGVEWADDLGADVVSSSLGYNDWYTYEDMDGNTALCTIAADLAVSKGIVVVNAAGNERDDPWHYIIAPADGDSVIAVGAVDLQGQLAYFSSAGPTYDGRIKPDVVACGVNTYCASAYGGYRWVSGTSLSTPLVAGVCALLLEVDSTLNPIQVREALWNTASQACRPDTLKGWGVANAYSASGLDTVPQICIQPESFNFYAVHGQGQIPAQTLRIHNIGGGELRWQAISDADWLNLEPSSDTAFVNEPSTTNLTVDITDLPSELHRATLTISGDDTLTMSVTAKVTLIIHSTNKIFAFPNPFQDSLTVFVDKSDAKDKMKISIFTVAGELVYQFPEEYGGKVFEETWDGRNEDGKRVSDGIYLLKVDINGHSEIVKVAKIR